MASQPWRSFKILVVSPTPTHPQDHGNRKRIFEICSELKRQGAHLHFVHFPSERDWRHSRPARFEAQMREAWDEYDLVAPSRPLHPDAIGQDHTIDEWADPGVASFVAWACRVSSYDAVIVNYTWMSFCLSATPDDVFKILCDGGSPSYLHSLRPLTISELQNPLHSCPNFCCGDKVTTRGSFSSGLYGGAKVGLFRNVTLHGFTGQLIRAPACLGGYLGELRFLLDAELNDHILRLGVSEVGVNSPGRR